MPRDWLRAPIVGGVSGNIVASAISEYVSWVPVGFWRSWWCFLVYSRVSADIVGCAWKKNDVTADTNTSMQHVSPLIKYLFDALNCFHLLCCLFSINNCLLLEVHVALVFPIIPICSCYLLFRSGISMQSGLCGN